MLFRENSPMIMYFLFFKNKACVLFCHARGPTRHRHSCCSESAAAAAIWLAAAWQRGLLAHPAVPLTLFH